MRIGIVTLPLRNNYGGILQNYALQQVLKRLGHTPVTIDFTPQMTRWRFVLSTCKSLLLYFIPGRRRRFARYRTRRNPRMQAFVEKYIVRTRPVKKYSAILLDEYRIESLLVGSDQVWRPAYNRYPEDMFLDFARHAEMRKLAYAASFGVGKMEFSERQLKRCAPLLQSFDRVSVREASGVDLCRNYFHVEAEHVLDPTLLLDKEDYEAVCTEVPRRTEKFMACYLLDPTQEQRLHIDRMAEGLHLVPVYFTADRAAALSVEEWLAMFRDAAYVVTDSFHGTVFSIIFGKPFITIVNKARGADRFGSLLRTLGLETRLISSATELTEALYGNPVDWPAVGDARSAARTKSMAYLQNALISR